MKKYFKDLDTQTKIDIIMNNEKLKEKIWYDCYEDNMEMQLEEGNLMLGERDNGIDIRDNYSSFYLVLTDWEKFLNNLDSDYLCQNGLDLYDAIMKLKNEYDNFDIVENEDRYYELQEELHNKCEELLKICERQLHQYEDISEDDLKSYLEFNLEENYLFENYYILEDDTSKVYNDVSYTETFE